MSPVEKIACLQENTNKCIQDLDESLKELEALYKEAKKEQGEVPNDVLGKCNSWALCVDGISYKITALRAWRETYGFFCTIPEDLGTEEGMMELLNRMVYTLDVISGSLFRFLWHVAIREYHLGDTTSKKATKLNWALEAYVSDVDVCVL